jgi:DNA primase
VIPQSFIQELLARIDIVEVVGRHVKLRKGGANWIGLCPFHGEKSPSFTVSPSKQFYHCFGCGAHGSAIGFLMDHTGLGYVDAIGELARSCGLAVPEEDRAADARRRPDPGLLDVLAAAARFYKQRLKDSPRAIAYLKGRGVSGQTAARFGIGYAPEGWRTLEAAVADYAAPALVACGLVIDGADDGEAGRRKRYDRFRDRVMFPIRNPRGQVIGFGGRVLGAGEPKYLNSPETPVFSKGRELYGLFEARDAIRRTSCVIVVEGYMDVVMLAQHGVGNAVATLGTATTAQHLQVLLRLTDRVVFAFDGDAAGQRAAWRALEACLPLVADTKRIDFLFLPPEHDPDSFVREQGAEGFQAHLARARPLSEFLLEALSTRVDLGTPEGRAHFQALARPLLSAMPAAALRLQLVQAVAARVGVRTEDLLQYLQTDARGERGAAADSNPPADPVAGGAGRRWEPGRGGPGSRWERRGPAVGRPPPPAPPDLSRRARLLLALHPALARETWSTEFLPESVSDWILRLAALPQGSTFEQLLARVRTEDPRLAESLQDDALRDRGVLATLGPDEARRELEGALNRIRAARVREEVDRMAQSGLDDEARRRRYAELQALRRTLTMQDGT